MTTQSLKRKLTAILSADVKGYSRLMGEDEEATVRTLTAYREVMASLIQQHRGRVVDFPGDNLLAEFSSMVDAVQCAVEIQQVLRARNAELPENRKMEFRIGVNLGDVIEEGERIYGDGVNIAARVEGLAEGGGICISGSAYEQIENKLPLRYEFLGEHTVKNIAKPIRVYRARMEPGAAAPTVSREKRAGVRRWQWAALAVVAVLVVGAGVVAVWNYYLRLVPPQTTGLELPEKLSIAVLPFVNISGAPEQEYFSDGMTEEIITTLSKIPKLFVIARNSVFTYKGKPVKVQQVGRELGVRYVLEGSVRKAAGRVRITAQLIDSITGHHLWAEQYDRDLKDVFALQDEITMKILTALQVKLTEGEQARIRAKGTDNLEAYVKLLQGIEYFYRFNKDGNVLARPLFEEAIALDPDYAYAYVMVGWTHLLDVLYGWSKSPDKSMERAVELAQKTLGLDDTLASTRCLLGLIYLLKRQHEEAIAEEERAITLNPNLFDGHAHLGMALYSAGRPEEAIASLKKAIRRNPFPSSYYLHQLGHAYRLAGRYEEAIAAYKKALHRSPDNLPAHLGLAATYSLSGREEEARAAAAEVLRISPNFSLEAWGKSQFHKDPAVTERLLDELRKAGLE